MLEATAPTAANPPQPSPLPLGTETSSASDPPKKKYHYVKVRLCMEDGMITTISLNPNLVKRAAKVLGSEQKAREIAHNAAMEYVEGKSPARTRSNHAARALQRLLLEQPRAAA